MAICVPIRDMKDTAKFAQTVREAGGPVTVTKNGYDEFVVMTSSDFEALSDEAAKAKLFARLAQSEAEYQAGDYADGAAFAASVRSAHGL